MERVWASHKEMIPDGARVVSIDWFTMLAKLCFLRFNYRHFHMRLMPTWTENDSRLCERVENLASVLNLLGDDSVEAGLLFGPFG